MGFHLEGDEAVIRYMRFLYQAFPESTKPPRRIDIHWNNEKCTWRADNRPAGFLFADTPELRQAATTTLIARLLVELQPEFLILHGNGLLRGQSELLLLVGESGAGKTTLTLELTSRGAWKPFAEDVLLMDTTRAELLPFPRAMALRRPEEHPAAPPAGEYLEHGRKLLVRREPAGEQAPKSLKGATVVLLKSGRAEGEAPEGDEVVWTSHYSPEMAAEIGGELPLRHSAKVDGMGCFEYDRPLSGAERARQGEILERHGALVFRTQTRGRERWETVERPPNPVIRPLRPAEGIQQALPHLVRPSAAFAAQPAGALFMRLSRGLAETRFFQITPGGTPAQTASAIEELVRA